MNRWPLWHFWLRPLGGLVVGLLLGFVILPRLPGRVSLAFVLLVCAGVLVWCVRELRWLRDLQRRLREDAEELQRLMTWGDDHRG